MRIEDEKLLDEFRGPGPCEICNKWSDRRQPHHIFCRGAGGGNRLDIPWNIISVGGPFDCPCHDLAQRYKIDRKELLAIAAEREIRKLLRAPKDNS